MKTFTEFCGDIDAQQKRNRMDNLVKLLNTTLWVAGIVLFSMNIFAGMVALSASGANTVQRNYDVFLIEQEGMLHRLQRAPRSSQ